MSEAKLEVGLKLSKSIKVDESLTVPHISPLFTGMDTMPPVFATAYLVAFIEWTCIQALKPYISAGQRTVGTHVNMSHIAATPIGMTVTVEVELAELTGKVMSFKVTACDDKEIISEGLHGRAIIEYDKFVGRIQQKATAL